ncbi:MAG: asparagine synthase (glutamine-hydrolyzing) [Dissulfuribacterales bacterium]
MCGIAGIVKQDGQPSPEDLNRLRDLLGHRGPNGFGVECFENVGLVHTRLSIIDLEGGRQPLHDARNSCFLVANGEIYNYVELMAELKKKGAQFLTRSDCETIIHTYLQYGLQCFEHLHGMFAFALLDREKRQLILARDRLGIKPLFYAVLLDGILFASELKALVPFLPSVQVNPHAISEYLNNQFNTGRKTIVNGIERVLPGEYLVIDTRDISVTRGIYWSPLSVIPRQVTETQALEEFDGLFGRVMVEHMRSDVPYGLFLSGGVDSAVICSKLHELQQNRIQSFSIGFREHASKDELPGAEAMAGLFGTQHQSIVLTGEMLIRRIPHTVWVADELMRDYAILPTSVLAETAARELRVVFTGEGGDEVFAGYHRYSPPLLVRWLKMLRHGGSGGFRTRSQWTNSEILNAELQGLQKEARKPFVQAWSQTSGKWSWMQRAQYVDMTTALPDNLLVKVDRTLMAFGLEGRVPFLDHRIVEFGLSLPNNLKLRSGHAKWLLKHYGERKIPHDHLFRKKRGFHVPIEAVLAPRLVRDLKERLPFNEGIRAWFDRKALKAFLAGVDVRRDSRTIWSLMQIAIWHRLFVEYRGVRVPSVCEEPLDWI